MVTATMKSKMFALWEQSYNKHEQHNKKQQRHHFATKICIVRAMVFPVVMYGCERWAVKIAECWKIDAFELWCWRVPWTARKSNQSILKEISPEYLLEGLRLKLQSFGHLMQRAVRVTGKDPDAGKDWRQEEKGKQRMRWLEYIADSEGMSLSKLREKFLAYNSMTSEVSTKTWKML